MSKNLEAVKPNDIRAEIDALRSEIEALKLQRDEIDEAWLPIGDAIGRVGALVDSLGAQFDEANVPYKFASILRADTSVSNTTLFEADQRELGQLLCFLFGDAIKAKLGEVIQSMNYEPGTPLAERAKARQKLEAQLFDLEVREEQLIVQAEADGLDVLRHPDINPAIVLECSEAA